MNHLQEAKEHLQEAKKFYAMEKGEYIALNALIAIAEQLEITNQYLGKVIDGEKSVTVNAHCSGVIYPTH